MTLRKHEMSSESANSSSSQRTSPKFSIPSCILTNSQPTLLARGESYIRSQSHELGKCKSRSEERGRWKLSFTILSIKSSLSRSGVVTSHPHMQGKHILRSYINYEYLLLYSSHQRLRPKLYSRRPFPGSCVCVCCSVMQFPYDLRLGSMYRICTLTRS